MLDIFEKRHSTRRYTDQPVEETKLNEVLRAARLAPTGSNKRGVRIYVIPNPSEPMSALKSAVYDALVAGMHEGGKVPTVSKEDYDLCYHAPVFLLLTESADPLNAFANAGCVMENAMLEAENQGLGCCWINIVRRTKDAPALRQVIESFGGDADEIPTAGLALGYAEQRNGRMPVRTDGNTVIRL